MCLFQAPSPPPPPAPAAPPPPAPPPPAAPKALPQPTPLEKEKERRPKVQYGRKKATSDRGRAASRGANALRIPINTPTEGGSTGGLNV